MKAATTMAPATLFIDADNTLWDTDRVFADAQLALLDRVELTAERSCVSKDRLAFVRAVDQALAERHHDGLRYPPQLLALALAEALGGLSAERAARRALLARSATSLSAEAVSDAERIFFRAIEAGPMLRPGVEEGLSALSSAGHRLFVITEGSRARAAQTLERLGLTNFFDRLIEGTKRPELYRRILRLAGMPESAFMIGDQLDRDIEPAKAAGLRTIYFPGGFRPKWAPDEMISRPDFKIESFAQVPDIVAGIGEAPPA